MSTETFVPNASQRFVITCYNSGTGGAIGSGDAVRLVTGATASLHPKVSLCTTTATITLAFGVALQAMATGVTGPVVFLGPAKVVANSAVTVHGAVCLTAGTAGVRGRVSPLAAGTAAVTATSKYLGYALTTLSSGAEGLIMVNSHALVNA